MKDDYTAVDHLALTLIKEPTIAGILNEATISVNAIKRRGKVGEWCVTSRSAEAGFDAIAGYVVDEGKLDPVVGRDNEVRRMIRILCRRTKNNPVLIGDPGGETAIFLIWEKAYSAFCSGKNRSLAQCIDVLDEIEKNAENSIGIILVIDELHIIAGRGVKGEILGRTVDPGSCFPLATILRTANN